MGDGHCSAIIIAAMAAVKRGSSLCEGCGTSNGNRALVCKGCGKPLSTKTKRAKRPEHVPEYSSNVTLLLDAELKAEIATAISVRVRPQGPDYRCFATKDVDGIWKCTNKDCEVVRQGRIRSMESGTSCDVFLTPLAGSFKAGELHLATVARVTRWSSPACFTHAPYMHV